MSTDIKVSVIVPIYNTEKYLEKCIKSIISQTYKNIEIILINDGSTDNSLTICKNFEEKDKRIKLINQENKGPSAARNEGIKNSIGDYILFVDSDDWIESETISILLSKDLKDDTLIMFSNYLIKNEKIIEKHFKWKDGKYNLKENNELLKYIFITEKINSPCMKLYSKKIIKENNIIFDEKITIAEDLLFNVNYIQHISNVCILNKCFYNYCHIENDTSLTQKYNPNKYEELMHADNEIEKILKMSNNIIMNNILNYLRLKNISSCFLDLYKKQCKYSKKEKKEFINKVKKDYKVIIINNISFKFWIVSIIYTISNSIILYYLYKIIYKIKKLNRRKRK